jgi:DNA-binding transcriptional LysR family regulator
LILQRAAYGIKRENWNSLSRFWQNDFVDELRDMALFVEVARKQSIKRAAEALDIPDSTLSRRITQLEKSLGLRLLNRTTRQIRLTEAGTAYFAQCEQIVEAAKLAQQQLKDMVDTPQGCLRLSLPVDFSALFLAPLIAEFAALYPKITFDLRLSESWVDLALEGIDLSIRLGLQPDSTLNARHIAEVRYALYAAPEYLRDFGEPRHPRELQNHACIRMVCPHWDVSWVLVDPEETVQITVKERVAVNNLALVRKFARLAMGIAPLDQILAREDVQEGTLVRVLPTWNFNPVPVFALMPARLLPAKARVFVEFLATRMKSLA